jgi:hypothetical protein
MSVLYACMCECANMSVCVNVIRRLLGLLGSLELLCLSG